jgi:hypothetical protein
MSLNPFGQSIGGVVDVEEKLSAEDIMGLDMSGLGTDGSEFVASLEEILGKRLMDESNDPFEADEEHI